MAKRIFNKRTLAVLLALVMVFNLTGIGVFAAEEAAPALLQNFTDTYYKQDGSVGSANDWEIHLSKTAALTNEDNIYDITLTIETKDISTQLAGATHGAVALVLDVSSSMDKETGTCAACGKAQNHSDHRGNRKVCSYEEVTHLELLKKAVKSFLDSYAATAAEGDKRLVAIVKFATDADTVLSWIDVNNAANLTAVKNAVDAMGSTSGTNIEAGLVLGRNLLNMSVLDGIPLANQSLILFSDGSPTVAVGNVNSTSTTQVASDGKGIAFGYSNKASDDLADILADVSAKKKAVAYNTDAALLNGVFGAANVIASSADTLTLDLTAEAGKIVTSKTNASTVTDPMGTGVSMITVTTGYNANTEKWDLSKYTPTVANGITTYTITYRVEIDPESVAADPDYPAYTVLTPANGETTLNYTYGEDATPVSVDFNEPNIRGIRSFTVRYEYVGEVPAGAPGVPADETYKAGQSVEVAEAAALENYIFSGWSKSDFVMPAEDVVITGSWTENAKYDYTLTYDANFGENETKADDENATGTYATSVNMGADENGFERPNYTFIGWNTQRDGSGKAYAVGEAVALTAADNEEVLYAQWLEHPKYAYSLVYDANFGENETKADEQNISGTYENPYGIGVDANGFERPNYTFISWSTSPEGEVAYQAGDEIVFTESGSVILYAQWIEHPKYDYSVIYDANFGGNETKADEQNIIGTYADEYDITVNANEFVRPNYTFLGWSDSREGEVIYRAGVSIHFVESGSVTLYAQWIEHPKHSYELIYNGNGGTLAEGQLAYGDSENLSDTYAKSHEITVDGNTFLRPNYTFIGWNTERDGSGTAYTAEEIITLTAEENTTTLYAQWIEHPKYDYSVIYDANFGENETKADAENITGTYADEYDITVNANEFVRPNYTFIGWNTERDGSGIAYTAEQIVALTAEENTEVLYAQWQINRYEYTVNYLVRINGEAYSLFAGTLPAGAPVGAVADFGTVIDRAYLEALGLPVSLADAEHTYDINAFEGITVTAEGNGVNVYYTCIVIEPPVEIPEEEIPEEEIPEEEIPEEEIPEVEIPEEEIPEEEIPEVEIPEEEIPEEEIPEEEIPEEEIPEEEIPEEEIPEEEIPEEEIPEEEIPEEEIPEEEIPEVEIPDEDVPMADLPKTGDPVMIYAALAGLSGTGLVFLGRKKKESEEEA